MMKCYESKVYSRKAYGSQKTCKAQQAVECCVIRVAVIIIRGMKIFHKYIRNSDSHGRPVDYEGCAPFHELCRSNVGTLCSACGAEERISAVLYDLFYIFGVKYTVYVYGIYAAAEIGEHAFVSKTVHKTHAYYSF